MPPISQPPRLDGRGLNFQDLDNTTPEEIAAYRASQLKEDGNTQSGFDYLLENSPRTLKTHRFFTTSVQAPFLNPRYQASIFGGIAQYALMDFQEGIRYCIVPMLRAGYTKDQVMEGIGLSFMVGGPRAMSSIAQALESFDWSHEPAEGRAEWPEDWAPDPAAFATNLDFTTLEVLPGEIERIIAWYENTIGWVPGWVIHFTRYNPPALKGWRARYEKALVVLPKQVMPLAFATAAVALEQREQLRENVLLARAFGCELSDVLQGMNVNAVKGIEKISFIHEVVGDLLEEWALAEG